MRKAILLVLLLIFLIFGETADGVFFLNIKNDNPRTFKTVQNT